MSRHEGIHQEMLLKPEHRQSFGRIIVKGFGEGQCNLMGFCEVGGHKKGLEAANILPPAIVDKVLADGRCNAASLQAYMCVWDQEALVRLAESQCG